MRRIFRLMALTLSLGLLLGPAGPATASGGHGVRVHIPDELPLPMAATWATILPGEGQWVGFAFFRDPSCVPDDVSWPAIYQPVRADCPYTVDGFGVLDPDFPFPVPKEASLHEVAPVPVWFVDADWFWAELGSPDGLTMAELATEAEANGLRGTATNLVVNWHPQPGPANTSHIVINARGSLDDGRGFTWHASLVIHDWSDPFGSATGVTFRLHIRR